MATNAHKWQPVMLVLNRRLECRCGALAIFVTGTLPVEYPDGYVAAEEADRYNLLDEVDVWCQACFTNAQQKQEDDDHGDR